MWVAEGWVRGPKGAVKLQITTEAEPSDATMDRLKRHVDTQYWLTYGQWTGAQVTTRKYEKA